MAKFVPVLLALCVGSGVVSLQAGFRSPESLVRNVYAHYGQGSSGLSGGLPRDPDTARQFFDPGLRQAWASAKNLPYDFLVQSKSWKLGAISTSIIRKQYDKTYIAVAFSNSARAITLNFIVVNGPGRLAHRRCRKPARFVAHVSDAVQELSVFIGWRNCGNTPRDRSAPVRMPRPDRYNC
jgi:hypothetical protein